MGAGSARGRLHPVGAFWLAAALVAIPPVYTAPSLGGTELAPLAFFFGLALAGLMAGAAVIAYYATRRRDAAAPIGALVAGIGVVAGVVVLADWWAAAVCWLAAVTATVAAVRSSG
jgi:peptidoglycan/LPS O-acetylase OafA/YrhL